MKAFERLLLENKAWVEEKSTQEPEFFLRLSKDQRPDTLWIGCADSRVPAEIIVNAQPGEIFVHRNIANQIIMTDFNSLSVLQYAVDVLKVSDVIVCGHYDCGGVKAALSKQSPELVVVNKWLMHIKDVYRLHRDDIENYATDKEKANRLVELNVIEQVVKLTHTSIIQQAWRQHNRPVLHGWVYGLDNGMLKQLIMLPPDTPIEPIYQYTETLLAS
ncbi:carbonic anhydrase [Methylolobus aquaticus]|uniref:carbonic anhydrase n=1 Tax=Methylotetracoccus oryzae TaxID=1919059 RepID=UPI00101FD06B|nr:carbonic anhydrase [Methylotetracoccus oryzae]RYU57517.1 carbonic anhydrase [Methylolobus aquaticus]